MNHHLKNIIQITIFVVIFGGAFVLYQGEVVDKLFSKNKQTILQDQSATTTNLVQDVSKNIQVVEEVTKIAIPPNSDADSNQQQQVATSTEAVEDPNILEVKKISNEIKTIFLQGEVSKLSKYISIYSLDILESLKKQVADEPLNLQSLVIEKVSFENSKDKIIANVSMTNNSGKVEKEVWLFIMENGTWKLDLNSSGADTVVVNYINIETKPIISAVRTLRSKAEIYYSQKSSSYDDFCSSTHVNLVADTVESLGSKLKCYDLDKKYIIFAEIKDDLNFCIDSSGTDKQDSKNIDPTSFKCP